LRGTKYITFIVNVEVKFTIYFNQFLRTFIRKTEYNYIVSRELLCVKKLIFIELPWRCQLILGACTAHTILATLPEKV
jgi:hypothetical protein